MRPDQPRLASVNAAPSVMNTSVTTLAMKITLSRPLPFHAGLSTRFMTKAIREQKKDPGGLITEVIPERMLRTCERFRIHGQSNEVGEWTIAYLRKYSLIFANAFQVPWRWQLYVPYARSNGHTSCLYTVAQLDCGSLCIVLVLVVNAMLAWPPSPRHLSKWVCLLALAWL